MNISTMPITDLKVEKPFSTLFPVGEDTLEGIRMDMESNGYDDAFPIIVWEEKGIVVDGHTRFNAALAVGLETVKPDHRQDYVEFCGIWSEKDEAEFNSAISSCNQIDPEDWS